MEVNDMKITKTQLTELIREAVQEQLNEGDSAGAWNVIMKLMMVADEEGLVEDIGQKNEAVGKVHEFAINNEIFVIVRLEDLIIQR